MTRRKRTPEELKGYLDATGDIIRVLAEDEATTGRDHSRVHARVRYLRDQAKKAMEDDEA